MIRFMKNALSSRFLFFACAMHDIPRPMLEGGAIPSIHCGKKKVTDKKRMYTEQTSPHKAFSLPSFPHFGLLPADCTLQALRVVRVAVLARVW